MYGTGSQTPSYIHLEFITIATTGNAQEFGESSASVGWKTGTSDTIRGVFGGGQTPEYTNAIEYIQIATQGNAVDFGDLITDQHYSGGACSNGHGGLG